MASDNASTATASRGRAHVWTAEEETTLLQAIKHVNGPKWAKILKLHGEHGTESQILKTRKPAALRAKAPSLYEAEGEAVPDFLDSKKAKPNSEGIPQFWDAQAGASSQQETRVLGNGRPGRGNGEARLNLAMPTAPNAHLHAMKAGPPREGSQEIIDLLSEDGDTDSVRESSAVAQPAEVVAEEDADGSEDEDEVVLQLKVATEGRKVAEERLNVAEELLNVAEAKEKVAEAKQEVAEAKEKEAELQLKLHRMRKGRS
ncbi:hypothetical protein LTR85_004035 [Meristemomyces frigidus]|nr:hypothetical protein LTR85_004035 [Meristemomyces frigidus]